MTARPVAVETETRARAAVKNIVDGECKTCGHTGYWCRCGEYRLDSHEPMTPSEAREVVITEFGEEP